MKIYIASHKYCNLPANDLYAPLFVGAFHVPYATRKPSWNYDDTYFGNISAKNPSYCELTALHWIVNNATEDIVGLAHYRRVLGKVSALGNFHPFSSSEICDELRRHDCLIARRENLFQGAQPLSVASHYRILHSSTDLILARDILSRTDSSAMSAFDTVMRRGYLFPCNIIVCKLSLLKQYSEWLFPILEKLESIIDARHYRDAYQARVFGFLAERLLNVFIENNHLDYCECSMGDFSGNLLPTDDCSEYPNLKQINLEHFNTWAPIRDGWNYSKVFDLKFYLAHNLDLYEEFKTNPWGALEHFLVLDLNLGRMAHPHFSINSYINGNPSLREKFGNDKLAYVHHYLRHPWDNRHVTGFENLYVAERQSTSFLEYLSSSTLRNRWRAIRHAEAQNVID